MSEGIRVVVSGAAGRMGATTCEAVEGAVDLELVGRADPSLGVELADVAGDADVVIDFTVPDQALPNARECLGAGVSVVIGTTGFDLDELREVAEEHWSEGEAQFGTPVVPDRTALCMESSGAVPARYCAGDVGGERGGLPSRLRDVERGGHGCVS